jgi:alpha-L-fucosidase
MDIQDKNLLSGTKPIKSYIKTILGKVYVTVWDSWENKPTGILLEGDPRKGDESCIIDIMTPEEDNFFKKKNAIHLREGSVITHVRSTEEKVRTVEEYSDDELKDILNSKFFTIQTTLNNTSSIAVLFRIKNLAHEMEKSDKLIKVVEARISEVQAEEFKPLPKSLILEK